MSVAYACPSIAGTFDDYLINSFAMFSVIGLESIEDPATRSTFLMGLYRYATDTLGDTQVTVNKTADGRYEINVVSESNFSSIAINWGDMDTTDMSKITFKYLSHFIVRFPFLRGQ